MDSSSFFSFLYKTAVFSCTWRNSPPFFSNNAFIFLWESPSSPPWLHAVLLGLLNKVPSFLPWHHVTWTWPANSSSQKYESWATQHRTETQSSWAEPWKAYPFIPVTRSQIHGLGSCAVTQDPLLQLVSHSVITVLKLSIIPEQGALHFHFSLGPVISVPWDYYISALFEAYLTTPLFLWATAYLYKKYIFFFNKVSKRRFLELVSKHPMFYICQTQD